MARNDNVQDFLRDVADAIRSKTENTDLINPQDIPEIIENLQTGAEVSGTLDILDNGIYNVAEYEYVNVGVPKGNAEVEAVDNGDGTQSIYINSITTTNKNLAPQIIDGSITEVLINDLKGATQFRANAFYNCTSLTRVGIPKTITSSLSNAFYGCSSLSRVDIEDLSAYLNISYNISSVSNPVALTTDGLYLNNNLIQGYVDIPNSATKICYNAFYNMKLITDVNMPDSVKVIENGAFRYCIGLSYVNLPYELTSLGNTAFQGCTSLTDIFIPYSVTSIGTGVFRDCTGLIEAYVETISSTTKITSASNGWFYNCSSNLIIHASSSLDATSSQTAFGNYWNYRTSSVKHTTYYDL